MDHHFVLYDTFFLILAYENSPSVLYYKHTFASLLTGGLEGKSTSVAFRIVFSSKMAAWDKLWPNGWNKGKQVTILSSLKIAIHMYRCTVFKDSILLKLKQIFHLPKIYQFIYCKFKNYYNVFYYCDNGGRVRIAVIKPHI